MSLSAGIHETNPAQSFMPAMRTAHRGLGHGDGRGWVRGLSPICAFENAASAGDVAMTAVVAQDAVMADAVFLSASDVFSEPA